MLLLATTASLLVTHVHGYASYLAVFGDEDRHPDEILDCGFPKFERDGDSWLGEAIEPDIHYALKDGKNIIDFELFE